MSFPFCTGTSWGGGNEMTNMVKSMLENREQASGLIVTVLGGVGLSALQ